MSDHAAPTGNPQEPALHMLLRVIAARDQSMTSLAILLSQRIY
jgi:hypothetical protein